MKTTVKFKLPVFQEAGGLNLRIILDGLTDSEQHSCYVIVPAVPQMTPLRETTKDGEKSAFMQV